ncbi:MAG: DUF1080 domain-containing protein [Rhodothermales bacterium]
MRFLLILTALALFSDASAQDAGWTSLFNGRDLDNWVQRNGTATYRIEDGAIVGVSVQNTPNSFLCTRETYGDFILEFEVQIDPLLNSGVQIRSESYEAYQNGRVHGYQIELDPSPRAWTAGIYDEARRGWLYSLTRNEPAQRAFKQGTWNAIRIEAIGSTIRTWINGVQAAHVVDDLTPAGFIALQVHQIGSAEQAGKTIRWRNIRIKTDHLAAASWPSDPTVPAFSYLANTLTDDEARKGWRLLWDGETTAGWRSAGGDAFPAAGWAFDDGILRTTGGGGDLVTDAVFTSFELEFDFRLDAPAANSGVKYAYGAYESPDGPAQLGLEYQLIDDRGYAAAHDGIPPYGTLASLYDIIPAGNVSLPGGGRRFNGVGQWNRARIVVDGDHGEHWLNNELIVAFDRDSPLFDALVGRSKFAPYADFGKKPGRILLQDHGDPASFRSIKIREW